MKTYIFLGIETVILFHKLIIFVDDTRLMICIIVPCSFRVVICFKTLFSIWFDNSFLGRPSQFTIKESVCI